MPRRLPLEDQWDAAGASWGEEAGWRIPARFGDPRREYDAVRNGTGVVDLSHRGTLRLTGEDRVEFLHRMTSADLKAAPVPGWATALLLTPKARVIADLRVILTEEAARIDVAPQNPGPVAETLDRYIIADDVEVTDDSEGTAMLSLQGPGASTVLAGISAGGSPPTGHAAGILTMAGAELLAIPSRWSGEAGFDLLFPAEAAPGVWDAIRVAGEVVPVGLEAREILRVEAGIPRFGSEFGPDTIPFEAGLHETVSLEKGCYPGQEVLARATHRGGVRRGLRGLIIDAEDPPAAGAAILWEDREVGRVTSAVRSPVAGRPVALAIIRLDAADAEGPLVVISGESRWSAEIADLPFYRRAPA